MLERLLSRICEWCERTDRVQYITGTSPNDVYLIRYLVVNKKYLKVYIHIFLRSDRDDPHDHPWNFWTLMVRGSYIEQLFEYSPQGKLLAFVKNQRSCDSKRWVKRKATDTHRVVLDRPYTLAEKDQAPMTFFFAGVSKREWGFVQRGEWIFWRKYLGVPEGFKARS